MMNIARLVSKSGSNTLISLDSGSLEPLARQRHIDTYIVSTEDGFSPLGANRSFLAQDLGIPDKEIRQLADWNQFENTRVSLIALPSRSVDSILSGVILAPSETSACYKRFATAIHGRPHRHFYYNVAYEALAHCCSTWGTRRPALSHLSASGRFHEDIATCNAEALAHYCDSHPNSIDSLIFLGCCMSKEHFSGLARLNAEGQTSAHRRIHTEVKNLDGYSLIHLDWDTTV